MTVPEGWTSIKFNNLEELKRGLQEAGLSRAQAKLEAFENGDLAAGRSLLKMFAGKMSSPEAEALLAEWMRDRVREAVSEEPGALLKIRKPAGRPRVRRATKGWRDPQNEDLGLLEEVRHELAKLELKAASRAPEVLALALDQVAELHGISRQTVRRRIGEHNCDRLLAELRQRDRQ